MHVLVIGQKHQQETNEIYCDCIEIEFLHV